MLQDCWVQENHVDVVVKFLGRGQVEKLIFDFFSIGQQMSDRVLQVADMTKNRRFSHRFTTPTASYRATRRVPRGLALLRALRLRLAAESRPHLCQAEFHFSK
jgi:hypothetical protein